MTRTQQWIGMAALIGIFAGGLLFRLGLTPYWTFLDTGTLQTWMQAAADHGVIGAYHHVKIDYPPISIALLTIGEHAYRFLIGGDPELNYELYELFVKLPSVLADYSIGLLLFLFVSRVHTFSSGLVAATIYLLNPAAFVNSSIWGQTDSMYAVFVVGSLLSFSSKRPILGAVLGVLGVFAKAQAVMFGPLIALLIYLQPSKKKRIHALGAALIAVGIIILPFIIQGLLPQLIRTFTPFSILKALISAGAPIMCGGLFTDKRQVRYGLVSSVA